MNRFDDAKAMAFMVAVVLLFVGCRQQPKALQLELTAGFIDSNLTDAVSQLKVLAAQVPADSLPRTFEHDRLVSANTGWWTSGFFPGSLLYLYEYSGRAELLELAKDKLALLEHEKDNTGTHDLGFMLYCSFGNALRITGDTAAYRDILLTAAESLSTRFNPATQTIRSWEWWNFPVIIDNMMNLELLTQASLALDGDPKYYDVAVIHANTTMKNHYRPDYSAYHVVDYDPETGGIVEKKTAQGAFDESVWARGQAWGLYGYVMMYRETGDAVYLDFARHIAAYLFGHKHMPADLVPYWDFDAPDLPADSPYAAYKTMRDASAAAILASALLELSTYVPDPEQMDYLRKAETILRSLSAEPYKAAIGTNGGFILKHSVGSIPHGTEIDVPLTYADYYYIEALMRYRRLLALSR